MVFVATRVFSLVVLTVVIYKVVSQNVIVMPHTLSHLTFEVETTWGMVPSDPAVFVASSCQGLNQFVLDEAVDRSNLDAIIR